MPRKGKNFKRLVRERQAKTGESYQAAHRQVAAQKRREYEACLDAKAIHARGMSLAAVVCEIFPRPQRVVAQLREALSYMPFGEILRGLTHFQQAQESSKYLEPPGALLGFLRQIGRCVKRRTPEQSELLSLEVLEEHLRARSEKSTSRAVEALFAQYPRDNKPSPDDSDRPKPAERTTGIPGLSRSHFSAIQAAMDHMDRFSLPSTAIQGVEEIRKHLVDRTRIPELDQVEQVRQQVAEMDRLRELDEVDQVRRHIEELSGIRDLDEVGRMGRQIDDLAGIVDLKEATRHNRELADLAADAAGVQDLGQLARRSRELRELAFSMLR